MPSEEDVRVAEQRRADEEALRQLNEASRRLDRWYQQMFMYGSANNAVPYITNNGIWGGSVAQTPTPTRQEEEEVGLLNGFLMGADPEFVVLNDSGRIVRVDVYFSHGGEVGWDHNGYVGELRPAPSRSTWILLKNLKNLIGEAERTLPLSDARFRGGAMATFRDDGNRGRETQSLGGHIHIDLNPHKTSTALRDSESGYNTYVDDESNYDYSPYTREHAQRMRGLDCFTNALERLDILPRNECSERRKGQYGRFGQFRVQPRRTLSGGQYRTEYRTMPSWLFHPKVAYLCLTGAKLISTEPEAAKSVLGKTPEWAEIQRFFEAFAAKDVNAKRAKEWLTEGKTVREMQFDPSADFKPLWQGVR